MVKRTPKRVREESTSLTPIVGDLSLRTPRTPPRTRRRTAEETDVKEEPQSSTPTRIPRTNATTNSGMNVGPVASLEPRNVSRPYRSSQESAATVDDAVGSIMTNGLVGLDNFLTTLAGDDSHGQAAVDRLRREAEELLRAQYSACVQRTAQVTDAKVALRSALMTVLSQFSDRYQQLGMAITTTNRALDPINRAIVSYPNTINTSTGAPYTRLRSVTVVTFNELISNYVRQRQHGAGSGQMGSPVRECPEATVSAIRGLMDQNQFERFNFRSVTFTTLDYEDGSTWGGQGRPPRPKRIYGNCMFENLSVRVVSVGHSLEHERLRAGCAVALRDVSVTWRRLTSAPAIYVNKRRSISYL